MFQHFYYEILRKTLYAFGTLFNNIYVKHTNDEGEVSSTLKVPIAYGPTQKFLARLEQSPNLSKPIQITTPRMSMEIINLSYNNGIATPVTASFLSKDTNNAVRQGYLPVPYSLTLELSIFTQFEDDMFQIIEQIIPYFRPQYTVTVNYIKEINEKKDINFVLEGIKMTDDYEGNFEKRRSLIWSLTFKADIYFYIPISSSDTNKNIINKVSFGFIAGDYSNTTKNQDIRYTVTPKAVKNYTGTVVTQVDKNIAIDDNYINLKDTSNIDVGDFIFINEETLYIDTKKDNVLGVTRAIYGTSAKAHIPGSDVLNITTIDDNLVKFKDPFSFTTLYQ